MATEIMEGYVQISERGLSPVQRMIAALGRSATSVVSGPLRAMAASIEGLGKIGLAGLGLSSLGSAMNALNPTPFLAAAASAESLQVSMGAMLKSGEKAKTLINDLNQFANVTPFDNTQVNQSAKMLLAFGVDLDQIIPTLNVLGDVAAGSGADLQGLGRIFGQIKAAGRLMTQDMNQLTDAGIPIIRGLAEHFKIPEDAVRDMVEKGKVSFGDFQKVLVNLSTGVGVYAGQMEQKSKTVEGLWSTLVGQSGVVKTEVGKVLTEAWKLPERMTAIVASIDSIIPNIPQLMAPIVPTLQAIGNAVWGAFEWFRSAGPGVMSFLRSFTPTFTSIATAVRDVFGYAVNYSIGAISMFQSAIQGLTDGGLFKTLESIVTTTFQGVSTVIEMGRRQMELMRPYTEAWLQVFYKGGQLVGTIFSKAWESIQGIGEVLGFMGGQLDGRILPSMGSINSTFIEFGTIVVQSIGKAIDNVRFFFDNVDVMVPMGIEKLRIFATNIPELIRVAFVNGYRWAEWFFSNFSDIMSTMGDFAMTTFLNLKDNLISLFTSLWKWVSSGFQGDFEFDWKPLTDGFQSQINQWPELMEAKLNETSPELDGLKKKLSERTSEWNIKEAANAKSRSSGTSLMSQMIEAAKGFLPGDMAIQDSSAKGGIKSKAPGQAANSDLSAKRQGSSEAFSSVLANMNRSRDNLEKAKVDNAKKANVWLSKIFEKIGKDAREFGGTIVELVAGTS